MEEGKVKYIGLSEVGPDDLRKAHKVHPVTAVQLEWSLWTRDVEASLIFYVVSDQRQLDINLNTSRPRLTKG